MRWTVDDSAPLVNAQCQVVVGPIQLKPVSLVRLQTVRNVVSNRNALHARPRRLLALARSLRVADGMKASARMGKLLCARNVKLRRSVSQTKCVDSSKIRARVWGLVGGQTADVNWGAQRPAKNAVANLLARCPPSSPRTVVLESARESRQSRNALARLRALLRLVTGRYMCHIEAVTLGRSKQLFLRMAKLGATLKSPAAEMVEAGTFVPLHTRRLLRLLLLPL